MKRKLNLKFFGLLITGVISLAYVNNSNLFLTNNVSAMEEYYKTKESKGSNNISDDIDIENLKKIYKDYCKKTKTDETDLDKYVFDKIMSLCEKEDKGYSFKEIKEKLHNEVYEESKKYVEIKEENKEYVEKSNGLGICKYDRRKHVASFSIEMVILRMKQSGIYEKLFSNEAYKAALYILKNGYKEKNSYFGNQFSKYLHNRGFELQQINYAENKIAEMIKSKPDDYINLIYDDIIKYSDKKTKPGSSYIASGIYHCSKVHFRLYLEKNFMFWIKDDEDDSEKNYKKYKECKDNFINKFIEKAEANKDINWVVNACNYVIKLCFNKKDIINNINNLDALGYYMCEKEGGQRFEVEVVKEAFKSIKNDLNGFINNIDRMKYEIEDTEKEKSELNLRKIFENLNELEKDYYKDILYESIEKKIEQKAEEAKEIVIELFTSNKISDHSFKTLFEKTYDYLKSKFYEPQGCSKYEIKSEENLNYIRDKIVLNAQNVDCFSFLNKDYINNENFIKNCVDSLVNKAIEKLEQINCKYCENTCSVTYLWRDQAYKAAEYYFKNIEKADEETIKYDKIAAEYTENLIKQYLQSRKFENFEIGYAIKELKSKYKFITR